MPTAFISALVRVSVSVREVMLAMATTAMQSTHASWTTVAAMTWPFVYLLEEGRGLVPALKAMLEMA